MNELINRRFRVFVYGTLKSGEYNNGHLSGSILCGNSEVKGYSMFNISWHTIKDFLTGETVYSGFPLVVKDDSNTETIKGQVYNIDFTTLKNLDNLESNGIMYNRELITVDGLPTYIYVYNRPLNYCKENYIAIDNGVFKGIR